MSAVIVIGEISTTTHVDVPEVARETARRMRRIGIGSLALPALTSFTSASSTLTFHGGNYDGQRAEYESAMGAAQALFRRLAPDLPPGPRRPLQDWPASALPGTVWPGSCPAGCGRNSGG